jgi:predicted nucleic acid-binding protein
VTAAPNEPDRDPLADSVLVDSDVVIEHLRGRPWATTLFQAIASAGGAVYYSPVTAAEIFQGLRRGEEDLTNRLFSSLPCLVVDEDIGRLAGEYLRRFRASHGLALGDALIGATASHHDLALLTLNRRHYPMTDVRLVAAPESLVSGGNGAGA